MKLIKQAIKYILIGFTLAVAIAFMDMCGLFPGNYKYNHSGTNNFVEPKDTTEDTENRNEVLDEIEFNIGE